MTIYTIYLITNLINGKKYVGQTKHKPIKRFNEHKHTNKSLISKAIKKYGKENFKFEVIYQTLDEANLDYLECYFIKEHNTFVDYGCGYNLTTGGGTNRTASKETREKMRASQTGRTHSEETKQKMSEARNIIINDPLYERHKPTEKYIEMLKNRTGENHPSYGKFRSEETCRKISDAAKGRICSDETRAKLSAATKGIPKPQQIVTCPQCGKDGGQNNMTRYHFDNCTSISMMNIVPNMLKNEPIDQFQDVSKTIY